ncbi:sensor histidine kinase [Demequina sp. SO4-13]|uniref:sensor histidine kinase n=1 Tax=Demequina sp. SO4-13 TaxID=3401027 RepID=UPI003AF7AB5A
MEWLTIALGTGAVCLAVLAAIQWRRLRRARARIGALEAELSRDTEAERTLAAADERARIAREMHDVVAHTLSVVVAQADGGRFAGPQDPAAAARALETIAEVGRSALAEMRAMLGLLRDTDSAVALGPQPSLADIPALVASTREGGLDVSYVTTGTPRPLPIGAGLAVYRIVQEALTNVRKHAGPSPSVYVQLTWEADAAVVAVGDDGRGAAARRDGSGLGIAGMSERVGVFGGSLTAGPRAGGGFLVRARLPLTPREATRTATASTATAADARAGDS